MTQAFEDLFAVPDAFREIAMPGRTDAWILAGAASTHGIQNGLHRFRDVYLGHLTVELAKPGPRKGVMPGIYALLNSLVSRNDVYLGLLTGNYESAARIKLEHFDLWRYFRCGAFGDVTHDRNSLLPEAVARVRASGWPSVKPSDVVVIGDTPYDVACAAAGGARSVAVATGPFQTQALREAGADVVFEDLSDTDAVLLALGLES